MGAWREIIPPVTATMTSAPELERMRRLAWEGVYRQGDVEDLLEQIREDEPLHILARPGGGGGPPPHRGAAGGAGRRRLRGDAPRGARAGRRGAARPGARARRAVRLPRD